MAGDDGSRSGRPVLDAVEGQLVVADIEAACRYFAGRLGFATAFVHGDPPHYAQVRRDGARLNLRAVAGPVFVGDVRERETLLAATVPLATAGAVDALFAEFRAAGADFHRTLTTEPWGARTFVVRDPDGNLILFAGPGG